MVERLQSAIETRIPGSTNHCDRLPSQKYVKIWSSHRPTANCLRVDGQPPKLQPVSLSSSTPPSRSKPGNYFESHHVRPLKVRSAQHPRHSAMGDQAQYSFDPSARFHDIRGFATNGPRHRCRSTGSPLASIVCKDVHDNTDTAR